VAITHGLLQFYITQFESEEVLFARELRATCLLNLADFSEAELEATRILRWDPINGKALYIFAESLYLQCKVNKITSRTEENLQSRLLEQHNKDCSAEQF
jgi:hypothetical protein